MSQSWPGRKAANNQPNLAMQWRVVAIFAAMIGAVVCGPIAGPSDLSRALGSVLDEETTIGIIANLLNFCCKLKFVCVPANIWHLKIFPILFQ